MGKLGSLDGFVRSAGILLAFAAVVAKDAFMSPPVFRAGVAPLPVTGATVSRSVIVNAGEGQSSRSPFVAAASAAILLVAGAAAAKHVTTSGRVRMFVNAPKKLKLESIPRPEKLLESAKFPLWQGTDSGYMARTTYERHAVSWNGKAGEEVELSTNGFATMNAGENLVYFKKKEHAICLTKRLRRVKINDVKVYRIKKDGTVIFMHPVDGVWPENQTTGRPLINWRPFPISSNCQQASLKWTKYHGKSFEADPLTTLFSRAVAESFLDQENIYPIPQPSGTIPVEQYPDWRAKVEEFMADMK